ncbi:MAG: HAMP domain-containing protein [Desulfuromonadaceae bacterium]|nr:HAMP domain-containing protein [Desulfuromonadaceae bacterium]
MNIWSWLFTVRRVGLRTEVLLNLAILLTAVLFFSCLLWVRFMEKTLISQRVSLAEETVRLVLLAETGPPLSPVRQEGDTGLLHRLRVLQNQGSVSAWALFDGGFRQVADYNGNSMMPVSAADLRRGIFTGGLRIDFDHAPFFSLFFSGWETEEIKPLRVSASLSANSPFPRGILVVDFPLRDIPIRIASEMPGYFVYALPAALIIIGFGVILLGKNVVRPLESLNASTRRVAAGDLDCRITAEGPKEFASLAESFNAMIHSLREKRREAESYIRELENTNRELGETREELIQAAKMASIGHLAAGMAHELGNPLAAVQGYVEILGSEAADENQREIAERALGEIERVNCLVRELLEYASPRKPEAIDCFDPVEAVREARTMLLHQRGGAVPVSDGLPESLPRVSMPRHQLVQVFVNLLINARDASVSASPRPIVLKGEEDGENIRLSVMDQGEGIPEENLPYLFEPFFTTRATGKGRGLGLAICRRIVADAGGRIEVASRPGGGTTFCVILRKTLGVTDAI